MKGKYSQKIVIQDKDSNTSDFHSLALCYSYLEQWSYQPITTSELWFFPQQIECRSHRRGILECETLAEYGRVRDNSCIPRGHSHCRCCSGPLCSVLTQRQQQQRLLRTPVLQSPIPTHGSDGTWRRQRLCPLKNCKAGRPYILLEQYCNLVFIIIMNFKYLIQHISHTRSISIMHL